MEEVVQLREKTTSTTEPELEPQIGEGCLELHEKTTSTAQLDLGEDYLDGLVEKHELLGKCNYKKLRRIIDELIETENIYVQDLHWLIEHYLRPVERANVVNTEEINALFGNIEEIAEFQEEFSRAVQEPVKLLNDITDDNEAQIFKRILFSISGAFQHFADKFKVYSSFTASHARSRNVIDPKFSNLLVELKRSHGFISSLESYMIKPIQRIVKYPLFLNDMCRMIDPDSDEYYYLSQACKAIEKVNMHINKMQQIYEEYGAMLDDMAKKYNKEKDESAPSVDLNIGELQHHGHVEWCNVGAVGLMHKEVQLQTTVFVFRSAVVFLCRGSLQQQLSDKRRSSFQDKRKSASTFDTVDMFKKIIPIREAKIEDGELNDSGHLHWWDLIHEKKSTGSLSGVFKLCSSSAEEKRNFIDHIRKLSKEQRPEFSKKKSSFISFGGKRLDSLARPGLRRLSRQKREDQT